MINRNLFNVKENNDIGHGSFGACVLPVGLMNKWSEKYYGCLTKHWHESTELYVNEGAVFFQNLPLDADRYIQRTPLLVAGGMGFGLSSQSKLTVVYKDIANTRIDTNSKQQRSQRKFVRVSGINKIGIPSDLSRLDERQRPAVLATLIELKARLSDTPCVAVTLNFNDKMQRRLDMAFDNGCNVTSFVRKQLKAVLDKHSDDWMLVVDIAFDKTGWHCHLLLQTPNSIKQLKDAFKPFGSFEWRAYSACEAYFAAGFADYAMKFTKPNDKDVSASDYMRLEEMHKQKAFGKRYACSSGLTNRTKQMAKVLEAEIGVLQASYDMIGGEEY